MTIGPVMPAGTLLDGRPAESSAGPTADRFAESLGDALAAYRQGDFLISSPSGSLLARGREHFDSPAQQLSNGLGSIFAEHSLIAGAIPFDPAQSGHFLAADSFMRGPQLQSRQLTPDALPGTRLRALFPEATPQSYADAVGQALRTMSRSDLEKVVLARSQRARLSGALDQQRLLAELLAQNAHAFVFATPLTAGHTLLGASPELLIRRRGLLALSNPLAGSLPRSFDAELDQEHAAQLSQSTKDLTEHAIVVEMVAEAMAPFCRNLCVPKKPEILLTNSMIHLSSVIEGELRDPLTNALDLALALHPTPAVCGWPTAQARQEISSLEQVDRGFYAGAVGWMDAAGNGEWAVSIRCAELSASPEPGGEQELRVFAGAGIVPGSEPLVELAETEAKFQTILRGLGLAHQDAACPGRAEKATIEGVS